MGVSTGRRACARHGSPGLCGVRAGGQGWGGRVASRTEDALLPVIACHAVGREGDSSLTWKYFANCPPGCRQVRPGSTVSQGGFSDSPGLLSALGAFQGWCERGWGQEGGGGVFPGY